MKLNFVLQDSFIEGSYEGLLDLVVAKGVQGVQKIIEHVKGRRHGQPCGRGRPGASGRRIAGRIAASQAGEEPGHLVTVVWLP